jgi:hypothetical protein
VRLSSPGAPSFIAQRYAHQTAFLAAQEREYHVGPPCTCGCDEDPEFADLVGRFERGEVG